MGTLYCAIFLHFLSVAMKRLLLSALLCLVPCIAFAQQPKYNPFTVELVRLLSKDLFELNSIPFLEPMVTAVNATSNARFYHTAYVPSKDTLYFRIGVHGMMGFVNDNQKTFAPRIPTDSTAPTGTTDGGLAAIYQRIKAILKRGVETGNITPPAASPTILGNGKETLPLPVNYLREEIKNDPLYLILDSTARVTLDNALAGLPPSLDLPPGSNINTIVAAIPQVEIGALYGTELLVRFIPSVRLSETIGNFSFWGIGIKHSISQYISDPFLDIAAQVVYQGTTLDNTVGVTNAKLTSKATFWNGNIHASKRFGAFTAFSGLSVENVDISADYVYSLPRSLQASLNLIVWKDANGDGKAQDDEYVPDPENGYPGDTKPQTSTVALNNTSVKWTIGGAMQFGPVSVFVDYNISKFNIFSGGLSVQL